MISKQLGMEVYFELHASNRSVEREIEMDDVMRIIDDPKTACFFQKNARVRFEGSHTVIIGQVRHSCLWIITVFQRKGQGEK